MEEVRPSLEDDHVHEDPSASVLHTRVRGIPAARCHIHPDGHDHEDPDASFPHIHIRSVSAASYPHAYLNGDWHSNAHSH